MVMAKTILESFTSSDIVATPFAHIEAFNVMPSEAYDTMAADFPGLDRIVDGQALRRGNRAVRLSSQQVFDDRHISPDWKDFFYLHTSDSLWLDIVRVFGEEIRAQHPRLEEKVGRPLRDFRVGRRGSGSAADIHLECQFTINTPSTTTSSVKTPHVDKRETIFAGLFYMRDSEDNTPGGDLQFYRWNGKPRFLPYRMILPGDVTLTHRVSYKANTLVCFVNSTQAVHGVSPRAPTGKVRRYVNLIAELSFHAFKTPLISLPSAIVNWSGIQQVRHG